jgi:hypothetical protein
MVPDEQLPARQSPLVNAPMFGSHSRIQTGWRCGAADKFVSEDGPGAQKSGKIEAKINGGAVCRI